MIAQRYPYWLAGAPVYANSDLALHDKCSGAEIARVACADAAVIDRACDAAFESFALSRALASYQRREILQHIAARLTQREAELAHVLAVEVGKPIRDARVEVQRAADAFRIAADEMSRQTGEYLALDISARARGLQGIVRRFPRGVCGFITPFNFPLNLAAHKVAPAIATGCPFVLKPASATPISSLLLAEIIAETQWPRGAFSVLPAPGAVAEALARHPRVASLSFTGSPDVGWRLRELAAAKHVSLELGGNAACIVDHDADLDRAAERITFGAFFQAGQSCISVQRVLAHRSIYEPLRTALLARAAEWTPGDPLDETARLGPLVSAAEAERVRAWIAQALAAGATRLCGHDGEGPFVPPNWLENVPEDALLECREAFGPVATLSVFDDFAEAVARANRSRYGLQAGVFTRDIHRAFAAFEQLEVGGVVINDIPGVRVESMPYGGVKQSGMGREGVRYMMDELTEPRLMLLSGIGGA